MIYLLSMKTTTPHFLKGIFEARYMEEISQFKILQVKSDITVLKYIGIHERITKKPCEQKTNNVEDEEF